MKDLMLLRDLTRRTGTIVNAQLLHLRRWPILLFEHHDTTARVNVEGKSVHYEAKPKGRRGASIYPKEAVEALATWTQTMLGFDWSVVVEFKAKKGRGQVKKFPAVKQRDPMWSLIRKIEKDLAQKSKS